MTAVWQRGWFWVLLALVSTLPFIIAPLPMMPDYFSHTARYHVMNHGAESPFLPQYYHFQWRLMGNLGIDLLMVPLGHWLPTETAARIAAAIIPPLTIAGIYAVGTAAWGRIQAPALLALAFVYSFTFLYGFVNYHLALALALLVLALWIRTTAMTSLWRRWLVFAPLTTIVWIAHMAGWGVLVVAIACHELAAMRQPGRRLVATGLRLLPLLVPLLLVVVWRNDATEAAFTPEWNHKLEWLSNLLRAEWHAFDLACLAILLGLGVVLLGAAGVRRSPALLLATAVLFGCFLVLPNAVFSSYYADQRMLAPAAMLFFLALRVPPGRGATLIAAIGIALFGLRIAETSIGWYQRGGAAVADLQALDDVPRGARIAVASTPSDCGSWPLTGLDHIASLAIIRREAFVDTEWDMDGVLLMQPIYNLEFAANDEGDVLLGAPDCPDERSLPELLADLPRERMDYVWIFAASQPQVAWLRLVHQGPNSRLYRIVR